MQETSFLLLSCQLLPQLREVINSSYVDARGCDDVDADASLFVDKVVAVEPPPGPEWMLETDYQAHDVASLLGSGMQMAVVEV